MTKETKIKAMRGSLFIALFFLRTIRAQISCILCSPLDQCFTTASDCTGPLNFYNRYINTSSSYTVDYIWPYYPETKASPFPLRPYTQTIGQGWGQGSGEVDVLSAVQRGAKHPLSLCGCRTPALASCLVPKHYLCQPQHQC